MEAICWCYYWGRISRTCTHVEEKVIWKFHRWSTSSVMRALWLHPVDAADRTVMVSPKSTYVEATSSRAVFKSWVVVLNAIPVPVLWICVFVALVTTAIHQRGPPFHFDFPPTVLNPLIFVSLYSNFIHSDSSQEEGGGFGANAAIFFFFWSPSQCYLPASTPTRRDI